MSEDLKTVHSCNLLHKFHFVAFQKNLCSLDRFYFNNDSILQTGFNLA